MARTTMAALISRVRLLINDTLPSGNGQVWSDDQIQDVMDEGRQDMVNLALTPKPTFSGSTIQFLNFYSELGGWEDDYVLKQYLVNVVTPSSVEPIAGHFQFAQTTLPPIYITGKLFDVYRSAADLLERQAAQWALRYDVNVDGQSLKRSQAAMALQNLARTYRMKQRAHSISVIRTDTRQSSSLAAALGAQEIDYMGSGNGQ